MTATLPTTSGGSHRRELPIFPNYTQVERRISVGRWRVLRLIAFALGLAEIVVLVLRPGLGLDIFWGVAVPVLPLLWMVAPGVWRNICPLAAANQTPRLFGFTRGVTAPKWLQEYGFLVAIGLFFALVASRKLLLNASGPATAVVLLACLAGAFAGGVFLKGKSGWCSTVCPLLPVQRLYGQTPLLNSPNSHCEPCLGCAKNCVDFNPHVAYLADQYDEDRTFQMRRRLFAAAFPGFIVAFFEVPDRSALVSGGVHLLGWDTAVTSLQASGVVVLALLAASLLSVGVFATADSLLRLRPGRMTTLAAATAFSLYYWFTIRVVLVRFSIQAEPLIWAVRVAVILLALTWVARGMIKEGAFAELARRRTAAPRIAPSGIAKAAAVTASVEARASDADEVVFSHPAVDDVTRVVAEEAQTLLELAEGTGLPIESGCRMGVCGADPVAVRSGADCLSAPTDEELGTLERLGHAPNTRMACVARYLGAGACEVALKPDAGDPHASGPPPFEVAADVREVVVLGIGIAGVTAADYVHRFHPDARVTLVGRESQPLYNRMAISRVVYGRTAMSGLFLQDDKWYADRGLECWLNTEAVAIDRDARQVRLGTGDSIGYDRLILATGSRARVPGVPGLDGPGSFTLRTADDAVRVRSWAQRADCSTAVVIGGGLLGLEAAYALSKLNLRVTVLDNGPHLLGRQLDPAAGEMLRQYLANLGLEIVTDAELTEVEREGGAMTVVLADGTRLPAGIVLSAAGVIPHAELADAAGLEVGQGVVVDELLRTSDPRIFAAGDCAEFAGRPGGLWPPAVQQAEVA
ncbi:MAG TPA: FAD-dependent oxidoreductase, partial [Nocardioides sp.]|nr:FAD-dependent oxidoreductase [Nocardioides sp.]